MKKTTTKSSTKKTVKPTVKAEPKNKLLAEHFGFKTPAALLKACGGYSNLYDLFNKEYKTQNLNSILVLERGIFQHTRELNRK